MSFDAAGWLNQLYSVPAGTPGGVPAIDAYGKNVGAAMAQGAQFAGQAGASMTGSYLNDYQPYDKKFMNYADNLGTDGYRAQQRGMAMAGVQQQGNAQMQAQNRQMMAMGVNPNSARFQANNAAMAQQIAMNKVTAAMGADRSARDEWGKALGTINAMGVKVGEMGIKNMGLAGDLSKVGMVGADLGASAADRQTNAGAAATGAGAAAMNAGTNATKVGQDYQLGLGKLALDKYGTDKQWDYYNRQLDSNIDKGSLGNTFGNMAVGAMGDWLKNGGFKTINEAYTNWRVSQPGLDTSNVPNWDKNVTAPSGDGYGVNAPTDLDVLNSDYIDVLGLD